MSNNVPLVDLWQFYREVKRRRMIVSVIACTLLALIAAQMVLAGTSNTIPQYGFLPGVTAYAKMTSLQSPGSTNGYCGVESYTSPSTSINVVGWTWWQCDRRRSDGSIVQSMNMSGSAKYNASSHQSGFTWTNAFSGGATQLKAHGVHDMNHTGSNPSPWRPYNVNLFQQ